MCVLELARFDLGEEIDDLHEIVECEKLGIAQSGCDLPVLLLECLNFNFLNNGIENMPDELTTVMALLVAFLGADLTVAVIVIEGLSQSEVFLFLAERLTTRAILTYNGLKLFCSACRTALDFRHDEVGAFVDQL